MPQVLALRTIWLSHWIGYSSPPGLGPAPDPSHREVRAQVHTHRHATPMRRRPMCTHTCACVGPYLPLTLRTILGWEIHTGPFGCESSCPERWQGHGWSRRGDTRTA